MRSGGRAPRPARGSASTTLAIAARSARVTLRRARSAADAARRSRPPRPNAWASWATSWSSSACVASAVSSSPASERFVGVASQLLDAPPVGRPGAAVEHLAGVARGNAGRVRRSGRLLRRDRRGRETWRSAPRAGDEFGEVAQTFGVLQPDAGAVARPRPTTSRPSPGLAVRPRLAAADMTRTLEQGDVVCVYHHVEFRQQGGRRLGVDRCRRLGRQIAHEVGRGRDAGWRAATAACQRSTKIDSCLQAWRPRRQEPVAAWERGLGSRRRGLAVEAMSSSAVRSVSSAQAARAASRSPRPSSVSTENREQLDGSNAIGADPRMPRRAIAAARSKSPRARCRRGGGDECLDRLVLADGAALRPRRGDSAGCGGRRGRCRDASWAPA